MFAKMRRRRYDTRVFLYAFDLLELDGKDMRREPFEVRKATLASILRQGRPGLRINEHLDYPGDLVFRHACKMGLEGIVSKRLGSYYRSGRTRDWLKFKNPEAPAVRREVETGTGRVAMTNSPVRRTPCHLVCRPIRGRRRGLVG